MDTAEFTPITADRLDAFLEDTSLDTPSLELEASQDTQPPSPGSPFNPSTPLSPLGNFLSPNVLHDSEARLQLLPPGQIFFVYLCRD